MKTLKELKNFCEKNNVRYEINAIYGEPYEILDYVDGKFKYVEHRNLLGYEIGMNNIAGRTVSCGTQFRSKNRGSAQPENNAGYT